MRRGVVLVLAVFFLTFSQVHAAPNLINYQGVLTDNTGGPVTNVTQPMTFRIFDAASGGTMLWEEVRTIDVQYGSYSALLGSVTPLDATLFAQNDRWLEIVAGTDILGPRQRLVSVPYALRAAAFDCLPGDTLICYTGDTLTRGIGACQTGFRICDATGQFPAFCQGEVLPGTEICDNLDNDCNNLVDDNAVDATPWFADIDADGFGDDATQVVICTAPANYVDSGGDCDDTSVYVAPGATEICDGYDNNCDSSIDEGCSYPAACTPAEQSVFNDCLNSTTDLTQDGACLDLPDYTLGCRRALSSLFGCMLTNCLGNGDITPFCDTNCPAEVQQAYVSATLECTAGQTESCGSTDVGTCSFGLRQCVPGGWWEEGCPGAVEPVAEVCGDGIDNDCNGTVDNDCVGTCTSCHGSGSDPAPPLDTAGNSATADRGVGAHQSHLTTSSNWHRGVICTDCHLVPASVADPGHNDTALPAELTWGAIATADSAAPSFNGTSCSGVYCHGTTLTEGGAVPIWTTVDGSQAACGTCHGLPPGGTHSTRIDCHSCHPNIDASNNFVSPATHVDGTVDLVSLTCTTCHGSGNDSAPPLDTSGNTTTGNRGVGAHQSHLVTSSAWHRDVICADCHVVPANMTDAGHNDTSLPAELTWGAVPSADGATPSFNGTSCSGVYCHGETLMSGGSNTTPTWTTVNGSQAVCGTCHGLPPEGTHSTRTDCHSCHPNIDASNNFISPAAHVDGTVDIYGPGIESSGGEACGSCHGEIFDRMADAVSTDSAGNLIASRHSIGNVPGINDSPDQAIPDATWQNPLDGQPVAQRSCTNMCHQDHPHTTATSPASHENNVYQDASTSASRSATDAMMPTDFDGALPSGGLCISCHDKPVNINGELHPALNKFAYDASAHNFPQGSYGLHDGTIFNRNCTKCHADSNDSFPDDNSFPFGSAHYSKYDSLLRLNASGNNTPNEFICFSCHGTGSANKDLQTVFGQTFSHPVEVDNLHNAITEQAVTWGDGSYFGVNRHVACLDCHNVHEAGNILHIQGTNTVAPGSPLKGATGVAFLINGLPSWTAPDITNFAWNEKANYEYEICFKCHSSFAWGSSAPGTAPVPFNSVRTDVAMEFNPNNGSYHAVVGASKTSEGTYTGGWSAFDLLTCADCHTSDNATDPSGVHGSASTGILRGAWNGQTGSLGNRTGHLCFDCHDVNTYTSQGSDNTPNSTGFSSFTYNLHVRCSDNTTACADCHGMIPHGWKYNYPLVVEQDEAVYRAPSGAKIIQTSPNWGPTNNWDGNDCTTAPACH